MSRNKREPIKLNNPVVDHLATAGRKRRAKLEDMSKSQRKTKRRNDLRPNVPTVEVAIDDLKPGKNRTRKTTRVQVDHLKRSLERYGWVIPIPINTGFEIVAGHSLIAAAKELQMKSVSAVVVDHLAPHEQEMFAIALNRAGETGEWDFGGLKQAFERFVGENEDLADTLFDDDEIDGILHDDAYEGLDEEADSIPPLPEVPTTRRGDVWLAGDHVVGCGDARDADYLADLLNGELASAAFIDAPYNVPIAGHVTGSKRHREFVMAAGEMSRDEFFKFLGDTHKALRSVIAPGGVVFSCMDWRSEHLLRVAVERVGFDVINLVVWVKTNGGMGSLYRSSHELIVVMANPGAPIINNVQLGARGRNRLNTWTYPGGSSLGSTTRDELESHSTPKNPEMVQDALEDVTHRGGVVIDSFLGSGTTLIAAARSGRRFRGGDLDPGYVDVALMRWMRETGGMPVLRATGETFDEVKARRQNENPDPAPRSDVHKLISSTFDADDDEHDLPMV